MFCPDSSRERGGMTNSTSRVFKAHSTGDLLALLPALFGFHPQESLIAITTHGERHRFGFRLRLDIPDPAHVVEAAQKVTGYLRAQDPDGIILLAISTSAEPAGALVEALRDELGDIPLIEAARGDGDRYWSYLCNNEACCPSEGTRYGGQCSEVVATAVYNGMQILPDRESLVRQFAAPTGPKRKAMVAATNGVARSTAHQRNGSNAGGLQALGMAQLQPIIDRHLGHSGFMSDDEVALFSVWGSSIPVRDELWGRLRRDNAEEWLELLIEVSRRTVPPFEPAILSLTSFAAWLTGDGVQALIAIERALAVDGDYSMANLILNTLDSGLDPGHWHGLGQGELGQGDRLTS